MRIGIQLAALPARDLLALARRVDELGFSDVFVPDHWAYEKQGGGGLDRERDSWEAMAILGAIAASTCRVRLGSLVLCNLFRHPASTAQATTTIDHVSAGRAILGIGSGWTRAEFEMMGAEFPDVKPRLRRLEESIRVIRSLWTQDRTDFEGEFYRLQDAFVSPKPLQKPTPPILLGGSGKGLLRIAARHADIVNVISDTGRAGTVLPAEVAKVTEEAFVEKLAFVRDEARAAGRDPSQIVLGSTAFICNFTDSPEAALATASAIGSFFGLAGEQVLRMPLALIGTPEQCAEELRRREREWGVTHYTIGGFGGADYVERFAREVLPGVSGG